MQSSGQSTCADRFSSDPARQPSGDECNGGMCVRGRGAGVTATPAVDASGEVVEWMYEEESRHPDLATYLETRKTTLLEMRADANVHAKRTEAEWDPKFR